MNSLKMQLTVDLKMANIVLGLQSHSSTFSCHICEAANPFKPGVDWSKGELRTLGSIRTNVTAWRNSGAELSQAKKYKNCVNMPLFEDENYDDSDVLTMHIVPPDELHLLLGLNHIYKELSKVWAADSWASKCHVFRTGLYQEFNGPGCNTLIQDNSLSMLESMLPEHLQGYAQTFRALSTVVAGCFSFSVSPTIKDDIAHFKDVYLSLNINVTPKFHIIFDHIYPYLEHKAAVNDGNWTGLAVETVQPFEAVHKDFTKRWEKFKVNRDNGKYKDAFHRSVACYNSLNVET